MHCFAAIRRARRPWRATGALVAALLAAVLVTGVAMAQPAGPATAKPAPASAATVDAATSATDRSEELIRSARQHFEGGAYAEGLKILNDGCREHRRSHEQYARLLTELARFYERYAGDHRRVRSYLREIRRLKLPPDHPDVQAARETLTRLEAQSRKYQAQDAVIARARVTKYDPEIFEARVVELERLLADHPDYPHRAIAYHYLGDTYLHLERYREAYRAFEKAIELRPGIGFSLPTTARQARAFESWVRQDLGRGSWVALGVILLLAALLLFASKPWRHVGVRHALVLIALGALWWGFFRLSVWVLAGTVPAETDRFPGPVFLYRAMGSPMSGVLDTLFVYGLVGVLGVYVMALATARFKPRWTWACANAAIGLVLFASLMTQFYLRHGGASFEAAEQGRYAHLRGRFYYFLSQDQDPFILTDPKTYCPFQATIKDMDEEHLQRWFEGYAEECGEP